MEASYDVVVIGSGLGGLVSANILAKEGYKVCLLEKNNQYGGNLQTFVRDRSIFDTGVHYIGGLDKGQNLYQYFHYLGIMEDLKLKKLDRNFDVISFDNDEKAYYHAQGYEHFAATLIKDFPEESEAIHAYIEKLQDTCRRFPLYNVAGGSAYDEDLFSLNAKAYLDSISDNEKLKLVLAGTNLLYAGIPDKTPFYVHALSVNSYIESSWRCVNGGGQISKLLIRKLRSYGGDAYRHHEVTGFEFEGKNLIAVRTKNGKTIHAKTFISNVDPKQTIRLVGAERMRKPYVKRIGKIKSVLSLFSLYIVLKPNSFPYPNYNHYHYKEEASVWNSQNYTEASWPESYMISSSVKKDTDQWAENLTAMTYMRFEEVEAWATSFNTVAEKGERGDSYEAFKARKIETFLVEIEKKFPNIRDCILSVHASTPLSYRDYIGIDKGAAYGYEKDANNPIMSFISPKTKLKNLFLTGQCLNMHGVLGVTISAVSTCSAILGRDYLLEKIWRANKEIA